MGVPQIIHLNGIFHHKPMILRIFWVPPFMEHPKQPSPGGGGVASWKGWKDTTDESAVYFADFCSMGVAV